MRLVVDKEDLRHTLARTQVAPIHSRNFRSWLPELDQIAPANSFQGGAVHELLVPRQAVCPTTIALLLATAAQKNGGAVAWSDPERELHLPALSAAGINLRHLILLRSARRADQLWALAECLRCRGVCAPLHPLNG